MGFITALYLFSSDAVSFLFVAVFESLVLTSQSLLLLFKFCLALGVLIHMLPFSDVRVLDKVNMKIMKILEIMIFSRLWLSEHGSGASERCAKAQCSNNLQRRGFEF